MNTVDDRAPLNASLDASVDAVIVSRQDGTILWLNKATVYLFGHYIEGLKGKMSGS